MQGYGRNTDGYDPTVAAVITDIKTQLREQGGHGKVWVDDWRERYGHLGSLRTFLESRPDKFTVVKDGVGGFSVQLVGVAKGGGKGQSNYANTDGYDPSVAGAITEIKAQLREQGGYGQVRITDWRDRFGHLGSMRSFVDSRPDKFTVYQEGNSFSIELKQAQGGYDPSVAACITEIKQQLREQGGYGRIWIEDWKERYGHLGDPRGFLEGRGDKFIVHRESARGFSIELVPQTGQAAQGQRFKGKGFDAYDPYGKGCKGKGWEGGYGKGGGYEDNYDPSVAGAITEIKAQLREQGGYGKVFIEDWSQRYYHLGAMRYFMQSRPDKFIVHDDGNGRSFKVELVASGKSGKGFGKGADVYGKGRGKDPASWGRMPGW